MTCREHIRFQKLPVDSERMKVPSSGEMMKFVQTLRTPRFRKAHTSTETWLILAANMQTPYRCRNVRNVADCGLEGLIGIRSRQTLLGYAGMQR